MKRSAQVFLFAALIAIFGYQVRSVDAYQTYSNNGAGNCADCHGDFDSGPYPSLADGQSWGTDLMSMHETFISSCTICHSSGGRSPVYLDSSAGGSGLDPIGCMGCHGRAEDDGHDGSYGGYGAGLRQHHTTAGVNCGCHPDANPANYTPVGEDVLPPYYANPGTYQNMPTDPCTLDGNENFVGSVHGLDNDGDSNYDGLDSDCTTASLPDIAVTDSVAPADDLQVPFGNVTVGSSADQTVTVTNVGTGDAVVQSESRPS
ncbi:MAG: hypothetical protein P8Y63_13730 [Deltaproteobacteria bacterium]